jgi:hypothetical protein
MPTFWAQSLVEYGGASGGGGLMGRAVNAVSAAWYWIETSFADNTPAWIAAGVCLLGVLWFFRKR